jgi:hypothetical protein
MISARRSTAANHDSRISKSSGLILVDALSGATPAVEKEQLHALPRN